MIRLVLASFLSFHFLTSCECESFDRLSELSQSVAHSESKALSKTELEEFRERASSTSFTQLVAAARQIEFPKGDGTMIPTYALGSSQNLAKEPWKEPVQILAEQLVKKGTVRKLHHLIYKEKRVTRVTMKLIPELGKSRPELAVKLLNHHYEKFFPRWGSDLLDLEFGLTGEIFRGMDQRSDRYGRKLLLEGFFAKQPFPQELEAEALQGIVRGLETKEDFVDFLNWKIGPAKSLTEEWRGGGTFGNIRLHFDWTISSLTLYEFAKRYPKSTTSWTKANNEIFTFEWPIPIICGWIEFWPITQETIPDYETRWQDALNWLVSTKELDEERLEQVLTSLAREDPDGQVKEWLNSPGKNAQIEQVKVGLRKLKSD